MQDIKLIVETKILTNSTVLIVMKISSTMIMKHITLYIGSSLTHVSGTHNYMHNKNFSQCG